VLGTVPLAVLGTNDPLARLGTYEEHLAGLGTYDDHLAGLGTMNNDPLAGLVQELSRDVGKEYNMNLKRANKAQWNKSRGSQVKTLTKNSFENVHANRYRETYDPSRTAPSRINSSGN
jgi:hypothetical protein